MQVLNQKEQPFAGSTELYDILCAVRVDIAVAQLVIQVSEAEFDVIDFIRSRRGRKIIGQRPVQILCGMPKLADLQGIPALHFLPAADKAARFFGVPDFFKNGTVRIHVRDGKMVDDRHDVDVAVFVRFAAQITALQAQIQEPVTEDSAAFRNHLGQIFIQINHIFSCPSSSFSVVLSQYSIRFCLLSGYQFVIRVGFFLENQPRKMPPWMTERMMKNRSAHKMKTKDGSMILV